MYDLLNKETLSANDLLVFSSKYEGFKKNEKNLLCASLDKLFSKVHLELERMYNIDDINTTIDTISKMDNDGYNVLVNLKDILRVSVCNKAYIKTLKLDYKFIEQIKNTEDTKVKCKRAQA